MRTRIFALAFLLAAAATGEEGPGLACSVLGTYVHKIALYGTRSGLEHRPDGYGAGMFLSPEGAFVTARHLFEESPLRARVVVEIADGQNWRECPVDEVIWSSRELDIAVVKVRLDGVAVQVPPIAGAVHPGETVYGFRVPPPFHASWRGSTGIVCSTGRVVEAKPRKISVRGDQFLVMGSSGSPVFNSAGQAIAVALEMVNWNPNSGRPDWTYTALPIRLALRVSRPARPVPVPDFLEALNAER